MTTYRFKGGIQNGTVATDARARKLDEQCKHLKDDVLYRTEEDLPSTYSSKET